MVLFSFSVCDKLDAACNKVFNVMAGEDDLQSNNNKLTITTIGC